MGKGDKKTKKGKITIGTYGVSRKKKKSSGFTPSPKTKKTAASKAEKPTKAKAPKAATKKAPAKKTTKKAAEKK